MRALLRGVRPGTVLVGLVLGSLFWMLGPPSTSALAADDAHDVVLSFTGTFKDSYSNGDTSSNVTLNYSESRHVEVNFRAVGTGSATMKPGPITFSASGSITRSDGNDCTISAGSSKNVVLGVESGSESVAGAITKDTIRVQAEAPVSIGSAGPLVLSGASASCAAETTTGGEIAPVDFLFPPPGGFQDENELQAAERLDLNNIDLSKLPYSQSFPAHWTETDSLGGTDTVNITGKFTVTGTCQACSCSRTAAAADTKAHATSGGLRVKAGPITHHYVTAGSYKFTAFVSCGTPNYRFVWTLDTKKKPQYLVVTPGAEIDNQESIRPATDKAQMCPPAQAEERRRDLECLPWVGAIRSQSHGRQR